jgi:hypothetical protein
LAKMQLAHRNRMGLERLPGRSVTQWYCAHD